MGDEKYAPDLFLVVRQFMRALAKEDNLDQRENLFRASCKVQSVTYSLIIDGGSCANLASQTLAEQLKVPIQWLNECGEFKVTKKVKVKFEVGSYYDEILYYVVLMQACHLLFGRP